MAKSAEDLPTVVVGAGIMGACTAYDLARRGDRRVMIIDRGTPASRTSGAGAGFIGLWSAGYADFWGAEELALQQYGIDFYRELHEAGNDLKLRANGNLFIALSGDGWDKHVAHFVDHEFAPADVRVLESAEVEAVTGGLVRAGSVRGAVLHPSGIQIDAGVATRAVVAKAVEAGAELITEAAVERLAVRDGRVSGVVVHGRMCEAAKVVVAAGAWTNDVLATVGISLPLLPICASRVVTEDFGASTTMPTLMFPELGGLWVREHHGGMTYGNLWGYEALHVMGVPVPEQRPREAELVESMCDRLEPIMSTVMPSLLGTPVADWVQGVPCHTPDRRFLAGPVPIVDGLFVVAGDNEAGVTHGPGLGRATGDLVSDGFTDVTDLTPFRLDRFVDRSWEASDVADAMPIRR